MDIGQKPVPLLNTKIVSKGMFIPPIDGIYRYLQVLIHRCIESHEGRRSPTRTPRFQMVLQHPSLVQAARTWWDLSGNAWDKLGARAEENDECLEFQLGFTYWCVKNAGLLDGLLGVAGIIIIYHSYLLWIIPSFPTFSTSKFRGWSPLYDQVELPITTASGHMGVFHTWGYL